MKKVSEDIASAFLQGKSKKIKNTQTNGDQVYLYGNMIAGHDENGNKFVTLAGWQTVTTRDRINAILEKLGANARFVQRNGEAFIDESFWDGENYIEKLSPAEINQFYKVKDL
jgi:hypothetical protein